MYKIAVRCSLVRKLKLQLIISNHAGLIRERILRMALGPSVVGVAPKPRSHWKRMDFRVLAG